jgi:hypothetical protein
VKGRHRQIAKEHDADILRAFYDSPEEAARREAIRLAEEKPWAERDANLKFWEINQRKRRVADMEPDLGRLDIHLLNHEGCRLAHRFYGDFFSPEFLWLCRGPRLYITQIRQGRRSGSLRRISPKQT